MQRMQEITFTIIAMSLRIRVKLVNPLPTLQKCIEVIIMKNNNLSQEGKDLRAASHKYRNLGKCIPRTKAKHNCPTKKNTLRICHKICLLLNFITTLQLLNRMQGTSNDQ
jgi:hypothetical protein